MDTYIISAGCAIFVGLVVIVYRHCRQPDQRTEDEKRWDQQW